MKDIRCMCEHLLKTPWRFLHWKDVIEWISNEKLHLCEQGLRYTTYNTYRRLQKCVKNIEISQGRMREYCILYVSGKVLYSRWLQQISEDAKTQKCSYYCPNNKTKIIPVLVCNLKVILYVGTVQQARTRLFCIFEKYALQYRLGLKMHFCPVITLHDRVSFINFITFFSDLVSHEKKWEAILHSLGPIYNTTISYQFVTN